MAEEVLSSNRELSGPRVRQAACRVRPLCTCEGFSMAGTCGSPMFTAKLTHSPTQKKVCGHFSIAALCPLVVR
jgi:hypothetical protein